MGMQAPVADRPPSAREPWSRRLVASLLYGRGVDRAAKTRARIALTVLVFALGYAVIAMKLVMFATAPEGHASRRVIAQEDRKSTRLNSSHTVISYAVFCLKK